MIALTEQQFQDFQNVVEWETATPLPDGRILGAPEKRGCLVPANDFRVAAVAERFAAADKTILELGPCEGYFTVQLARICRHLTAIELRPKNLVCTMIRLFLHAVRNCELHLGDVRDLDTAFGRFDILFHAGVFYHLDDPVGHLFKVRSLAPRLLLDTHYVADGDNRFQAADLRHDGKTYRAVGWHETGWQDIWAGAQPTSRLLYLDSLMELLQDAGFDRVEVVTNQPLAFAPRVVLLAEQTGTQSPGRETVSVNVLAAQVALLESELASARREVVRLRGKQKFSPRASWRALAGRFLRPLRRLLRPVVAVIPRPGRTGGETVRSS